MSIIYTAYLKLNNQEKLDKSDFYKINADNTIKDFQLTSLLSDLLLTGKITDAEQKFIDNIKNKLPEVEKYISVLCQIINGVNEDKEDYEFNLLNKIHRQLVIGKPDIDILIGQICLHTINYNFLALFLVLIKHFGLKKNDLIILTDLMANSGKIYDYRNNTQLNNRKVVRRYPTGALSEKTALIMPSLLMAFSKELPICSTFIIAKSLSYTGGTWDKLRSIDGFTFPAQGNETLAVMQACNIAMTVTENDFNPADEFLYQFRSISNSVESIDLILSSIASKQMGVPADSLIVDTRYGSGAFFKSETDTRRFNKEISELLNIKGIKTKVITTGMIQPTGSCVGNYWEVLEAIAVMNYKQQTFGYDFEIRGLQEQFQLVLRMTVELLNLEFPDLSKKSLEETSVKYFKDGSVFTCFLNLLKKHNVDSKVVNKIKGNQPWKEINSNESHIIASVSGTLIEIKQKELGIFVNFELGAGRNKLSGFLDFYNGIILQKRLGDTITKGDILAKVMHSEKLEKEQLFDNNFFIIMPK